MQIGSEPVDILIVDDQESNLISLEALLGSPLHNLIRARSGEEALEIVLHSHPALIILDVQMPGMDGFEVARTLRSSERTKAIPIIFATATLREEKFSFQGFEAGAVDYLFKPLNPIIVASKVAVFVDLHRNRLRLERALNDLTTTNRELDSFAHSIAHELRAPARAIVNYGEILMAKVKGRLESGEIHELQRLIEAGKTMHQLVDGMMSLARTSRQEALFQKVDLSSIAKKIEQELKSENPQRRVDFQAEEGLIVNGDRQLLETALRNLIGNAWKYTTGQSDCKISFGSQKRGHNRVFVVQDNGAGFNMEYSGKLFGVFQRLHSQEEFQGTGVGLATVQRIIHRHGGKIWAEGSVGKGASFYFTLGGS